MSGVYISESKRRYNVIPSVYYFYVKTKMLANFQICISVPLMCLISNGSWQYYFVLFDKLNVHLCINHFLLKKGFRPKYFIFYRVVPYFIPPLTLFRMGFFGADFSNLSHISYIDETWHSYTLPKEDPQNT